MGHGHSHGTGAPAPVRRRTRVILTLIVLVLLGGSVAGMAVTWPRDVPGLDLGFDATTVRGEVTSTRMLSCEPEIAEEWFADGTMPETVECPEATVRLGDDTEVTIQIPTMVYRAGLDRGDRVVLTRYPAVDGGPVTYVWEDVDRRWTLAVTVGVFALLTVLVGRRRGLAALFGLGLGGLAIAYYVLPALLAQQNAIVVGLSASTAVMCVVLYTTHGFSARTTVAFLGTVAGLALTAVLAVVSVQANRLQGVDDEDSYAITMLADLPDLRGVVLAGTLVAALGLLNDVTITQAAAVWEVRAADPAAGLRKLFVSGMRVGRDHLASTVYTVAFAYAGAALPTLLLLRLYGQPLELVLSQSAIATELVRTAVGGAALALAVPATTALAAALVGRATIGGDQETPAP